MSDMLEQVTYERVEMSVQYIFRRTRSMYSTRRNSKLRKTSKKASETPVPHDDAIQRRVRSNRRREQRQAGTGDDVGVIDARTDCGIIDLINGEQDTSGSSSITCSVHVTPEDQGKPLEVVEEETVYGDQSPDSCYSLSSGPGWSPVKPSPPRVRCSACQTLYQKAKKMKAPLKDKLLDNDPTSLTCDQWMLKKKWLRSGHRNVKGKLWTHLRLVRKRLGEKQSEQCVGKREQSACSRPHTFLQRNLRHCVKVLAERGRKKVAERGRKKASKRGGKNARSKGKRKREDTETPRTQYTHLAKQQRLHDNSLQQYSDGSSIVIDSDSNNPLYSSNSEQVDSDQSDTPLIIEVSPSSVTMETTKPTEAPPKQKVPERRGGFRDLLIQLRGNSSTIVREPR